MIPVEIRNIKIGEGIPKICVPVVGRNIEEIVAQAKEVIAQTADILEWRVDFFENVGMIHKVIEAAKELRQVAGELPVLFTFRSRHEGGECELTNEEYVKLNKAVAESGFVDAVDVEIFTGQDIEKPEAAAQGEIYSVSECVKQIIADAHAAGIKVVASNHDFNKTPACEELVKRLRSMKEAGADIPKIAVMPQSKKDVLSLMLATTIMTEDYTDGPVISMSMSGKGVISRIAGEGFGSALTFGCAGKASAPGQVEAGVLKKALEAVDEAMGGK